MPGLSIKEIIRKNNIIEFIFTCIAAALVVADVVVFGYKTETIALAAILILYMFVLLIMKRTFDKSVVDAFSKKTEETDETANKIIRINEHQKNLTDEYNQMTNNIVKTVKLLKSESEITKTNIAEINDILQSAVNETKKESSSLSENTAVMQNLKNKVQVIAELIIELTDYVKQIGSTVNIVENISEQTNLLALNAAVEAARAGEYGKGFSVVAGEIRKLADESKQATNKITALVSDIEQTTSSTIMAAEDSAKEIEHGVEYASELSTNANELYEAIKNLELKLADIGNSVLRHENVTDTITESVDNMRTEVLKTINVIENGIKDITSKKEGVGNVSRIVE